MCIGGSQKNPSDNNSQELGENRLKTCEVGINSLLTVYFHEEEESTTCNFKPRLDIDDNLESVVVFS